MHYNQAYSSPDLSGIPENVFFKSKWSNSCELIQYLGQRFLLPILEIFSYLPNLPKLVLQTPLLHRHISHLQAIRPSITIQLLLPYGKIPVITEKPMAYSGGTLKATEGPEHVLLYVPASNLGRTLRCPLVSWPQELLSEICGNIYFLSSFPIWSCGVHAGAGSCASTPWLFCCSMAQKRLRNWGRAWSNKASWAEHPAKSSPSFSTALQSLAPYRRAAASLLKSRAHLSPRRAPLADNTLHVLHYYQRLQCCCLASFCNPKL